MNRCWDSMLFQLLDGGPVSRGGSLCRSPGGFGRTPRFPEPVVYILSSEYGVPLLYYGRGNAENTI